MRIFKLIFALTFSLLVWLPSFAQSCWVDGHYGRMPRGAMVVGNEADGTLLYLCRKQCNGIRCQGLQPGKVSANLGTCNVPYGGQELTFHHYQVYIRGYGCR